MMGRRARAATAAIAGGLLCIAMAIVPAVSASAATDTTGPQLTLPPYAQFLQGAQLGATSYLDGGGSTNLSIPLTVGWSAKDASGICGYTLKRDNTGGPPDTLLSRTNATTYQAITTDYTDQEGSGGGYPIDWRVIAHDCVGNQTAKTASITSALTQDNGTNDGQWPGVVTITYSGNWSQSLCTCYDAGTVEKTSAKGARATLTFDANAQDSIALVMEKAANRGKFAVLVDGVNAGTIDNYSRTTLHKVIVWSGRVSTTGSHVVTLINQATSGRPRIDLDAVLRMY